MMENVAMTVQMTADQRRTMGVIERFTGETPVFHGYEMRGSDREFGQENAVWLTFEGIYVLIQPNGDTEHDVMRDFLDLDDATIESQMRQVTPGFYRA
jgi:hypothetical protein